MNDGAADFGTVYGRSNSERMILLTSLSAFSCKEVFLCLYKKTNIKKHNIFG
ncbi:hypothetical protein BSM4216_1510 [Bacillus smithii]|nr:hypothetical protein BSM4216_1510 [Bacillus smithii]